MVRRRDPPSQGWRTFLRNHADGIAAMDMFVVPTSSVRYLGIEVDDALSIAEQVEV
jgi:hypothetical protein